MEAGAEGASLCPPVSPSLVPSLLPMALCPYLFKVATGGRASNISLKGHHSKGLLYQALFRIQLWTCQIQVVWAPGEGGALKAEGQGLLLWACLLLPSPPWLPAPAEAPIGSAQLRRLPYPPSVLPGHMNTCLPRCGWRPKVPVPPEMW